MQHTAWACELPFAVVVNEDKAACWLRQNYPRTRTLFRVTGQDWGAGAWKVYSLLPLMQAVSATYFSIANEWLPDATPEQLRAACQGYIEAMDVVKPYGIKLAIGDLTTHHPDLRIPGMLAAMRPMLQKAQAEGHAVNVHVYLQNGQWGDPGVWQAIAREFPSLKIIIGELGVLENDGTMTAEAFANLLRYDDLLTAQVIGAALYTLTDQSWAQCKWDAWIGDYAEHVTTWR